jgi:cytochrome c oxidase assembly protein subunit 15
VDEPAVSHYRLAAHLSLAFLIFFVLLWFAFSLEALSPSGRGLGEGLTSSCQKRHGWFALGVLSITILWGAFTAGLDGGMLYNTWPKVDQNWVAPEIFLPLGWLENAGGVQFVHRWLAIAALAAIVTFAWRRKDFALTGMAFFQVALGIATVLTQLNIAIAAAHQAGALILLALMVRQLHRMRS